MKLNEKHRVVAFFVCVCSEGGQYCRAGVSETPVRLIEKKKPIMKV